jgi:hypothetical protein
MKALCKCFVLLAGLVVLNACDKDPSAEPVEPEIPVTLDTLPHEPGVSAPNLPGSQNRISSYRLSSIDYNTEPSGKGYYHYNADGTVQQIQFSFRGGTATMNYTYNNQALSQIMEEHSEYKTEYTYEKGWISNISQLSTISHSGYKFFFSYNANGTVANLRYYNQNDVGSTLIYTSTYTYGTDQLLKKITSVGNNSSKVISVIESYSDECDFNPLTFVNNSLGELYTIYNLPVLSQMKRLPKKIKEIFVNSAGTPISEMNIEYNYTFTGKRLDTVLTSTRYPASPQSNHTSEMALHY